MTASRILSMHIRRVCDHDRDAKLRSLFKHNRRLNVLDDNDPKDDAKIFRPPLSQAFMSQFPGRARRCAGFALCGLALACAPDVAGAQTPPHPPLGETPFEVMLRWRPKAETPEPPDFVRASRPAPESMHYAPLTGPSPSGPARRSPEDLQRLKARLDSAASRNRARAARDFAIGAPKPKKPAK